MTIPSGGGSAMETLQDFRRELAERFRCDDRISDELRSALVWACLTPRPPRTKKALARKAGISPVTLWRHAQQEFPRGPDLGVILQFINLLADLQAQYSSGENVSRTSGLQKSSIKILGVTPLDESEAVVLVQRWAKENLH